RIWHEGRWFFSVIDVIGVLTDSPNAGAYWRKLRQRMREDEGASEVVTNCHRLKLTATDGKKYLTDTADTQTLLRIIQSVPSPKGEPVKQWLAGVGAQLLEEVRQPLSAPQVGTEPAVLEQPAPEAPALAWAKYYEQLALLYRRQAAYEAQMAYVDAALSARL